MRQREYVVQFLLDMDWIRQTAIYNNIETVRTVVADLAFDGHITRILARNRPDSPWYTVKVVEGQIVLDRPVDCPR